MQGKLFAQQLCDRAPPSPSSLLHNHASPCFDSERHDYERIKCLKSFNAEEDISLTF